MPLYLMVNIIKKMEKLIDTYSSDLSFRRVYIPKGEDQVRPLGVPNNEWRLYLYMVNNFLRYFILEHMDPSQHGFYLVKVQNQPDLRYSS